MIKVESAKPLDYMRQVWASGACHPDSLTQTSNEVREQLIAGQAGSGDMHGNPDVGADMRKHYDAWWRDVEPRVNVLSRLPIGTDAEPETLLSPADRVEIAVGPFDDEGAAIGLLNAPAKSRLLRGIARKVHEQHLAEIPEKEVVKHFARVLPALGRPPGDARKIVEEIRDRSGVLVEKRPGYFGFSHPILRS